jgi:hypothetical protein
MMISARPSRNFRPLESHRTTQGRELLFRYFYVLQPQAWAGTLAGTGPNPAAFN